MCSQSYDIVVITEMWGAARATTQVQEHSFFSIDYRGSSKTIPNFWMAVFRDETHCYFQMLFYFSPAPDFQDAECPAALKSTYLG